MTPFYRENVSNDENADADVEDLIIKLDNELLKAGIPFREPTWVEHIDAMNRMMDNVFNIERDSDGDSILLLLSPPHSDDEDDDIPELMPATEAERRALAWADKVSMAGDATMVPHMWRQLGL